jgi:hypothetical protein
MARPVENETNGPNWHAVTKWLLQYQKDHKRFIELVQTPVEYANGHTALCVSLCSYRRLNNQAHDRFLHSELYWPNKRYVSLPSLCIALIFQHEKETDDREQRGWPEPQRAPEADLPL